MQVKEGEEEAVQREELGQSEELEEELELPLMVVIVQEQVEEELMQPLEVEEEED